MPIEPQSTIVTGAAALAGSVIAPLSAWVVARRHAAAQRARQTGEVDTSDANELWRRMTEQLDRQQTHIDAQDKRIEELWVSRAECFERERELGKRVLELERRLDRERPA